MKNKEISAVRERVYDWKGGGFFSCAEIIEKGCVAIGSSDSGQQRWFRHPERKETYVMSGVIFLDNVLRYRILLAEKELLSVA